MVTVNPMLKRARRPLFLVFTLLLLPVFFGASPFRALAQSAPGKLTGPASLQQDRVFKTSAGPLQISGHVPNWATAANDRGIVPDSQKIPLILTLSRAPEVEAAFQQLLVDQQNPSSPRYHQWLTPQQVGEQYGPTQHDLDALTAWLTSQGLTVDSIEPSRIFVQVSAPASTVSTALHTSLHSYGLQSGNLQAPAVEPTLPANLASVVSYIGGLTSVPNHVHSHIVDSAELAAEAKIPSTLKPDYTTSTGYHALLPADFTTIYDLQPAYNSGITGNGYKIAIIGGSQLLAADVANYETLANLKSYSPNTIVPTGQTDPGTSVDDQTEGMLDFERAYGTAPGAPVDFIIAKNWLNGTVTQQLLQYAIGTVNDPVLSLSFGACEALQTPTYIQSENTLFSTAASQGISVFVSSGDSGVEGCEGLTSASTLYASISDYCASGFVTCVGGTEFADTASPSTYWSAGNGTGGSSALSYIPEGGWNDPLYSTGVYRSAASGGGVSTIIPKPSFQKGTGVPADGFRDVPDISFSGSVHNAYVVCQNGSASKGCNPASLTYLLIGGTSASAPSMAGVAAMIDQKLGARQGNMNTLLYSLYAAKPAVFHDATPASSGVASCTLATPSMCNNSVPQTSSSLTPSLQGYALTTGYDLVTGLGSLDVSAFLTAAGLPTPTGVVTATPSTINISQTVKLTATFTAPSGSSGTPSGTAQFYSNGAVLGSPVTLAGGVATTASLSFAPAATYLITAVYSGDSAFSTTTTPAYSLVVTNPTAVASSSTLAVTPSTAVTTTQAVTYTATVKGAGATPTGTVTFYDAGTLKSTINLSAAGIATYTPGVLAAGSHVITCVYSGDSIYATSSCASVTVVATAVATATTASVTPSTATAGATPLLGFSVVGAGGTPTGSVAAYLVGTTTALGTVTLANGVASGSLTGFGAGTYTFYGVYSGDATYASSTSNNVTLTITGFGLTSSPTTVTLTSGATAGNTVTAAYTSVNGFVGTIGQTCSLTLNSGTASIFPTCTLSPTSVTLASGGTASVVATIGTVAPHAVNGGLQSSLGLSGRALGGMAFAGLLILVFPGRRRTLRTWRGLAMALFLAAALFSAGGCGSSSTAAVSTVNGTTKGIYTMTITGTSGTITTSTTTTVVVN